MFFFNRIVFSIKNEKARKEYSESLYVIIENINSVPIVSFICGLAELIHFDEKFLELIPLRKDELKNAFINNFNDSLDVFRGDAPLTIFGYSSIGKIDITEIRKKASNTILDLIPIEQFANYISNSEPRDWLTIESIGRILYKYERIEYKEIVETIDFNKLSKASQDLWENSSHDLIYLIVFLGMGDAKLTSDFILNNLHLIKKMDLMILSYIPDKISSCIENGISVELFSGYNTGLLYDVLLYYLETKSLKKVLLLTKNDFINKVKDLCILDFERYEVGNDKIFNDVLSLIENENEEFLNDSFSYIDDNLLLEIKRKMDNDNRLNNDIKKNFNYFINLFSKYTKRDMRKMIYQINDK